MGLVRPKICCNFHSPETRDPRPSYRQDHETGGVKCYVQHPRQESEASGFFFRRHFHPSRSVKPIIVLCYPFPCRGPAGGCLVVVPWRVAGTQPVVACHKGHVLIGLLQRKAGGKIPFQHLWDQDGRRHGWTQKVIRTFSSFSGHPIFTHPQGHTTKVLQADIQGHSC